MLNVEMWILSVNERFRFLAFRAQGVERVEAGSVTGGFVSCEQCRLARCLAGVKWNVRRVGGTGLGWRKQRAEGSWARRFAGGVGSKRVESETKISIISNDPRFFLRQQVGAEYLKKNEECSN